MSVSFIALNRLVENKAAKDPNYRRSLERNGKPLLSQARKRSDAELLEDLHRVGIDLNKASYAEVAEHAMSAQEIAQTVVTAEVRSRFQRPFDEDRVWLALTVLWERWFPHWPNLEQLDDRLQAGYALAERDSVGACEQWLKAWPEFLVLFDMGSFKSIGEFDDAFRGTQFVSNWIGDLEMELANAALKDPLWHERRIHFCEEFLRRFPNEDELTIQNMRRALAEATFGARGRARGDALFEQWLKADPQWGWGWIGWSDCYAPFTEETHRDLPRAEALLKQGLEVPGVRDREDLWERLAELCREQGRHAEADEFDAQGVAVRHSITRVGDRTLSMKTKLDFGEEGIPLDQLPHAMEQVRQDHEQLLDRVATASPAKVGRNDPCPCGSGRKYKKCCLAKDEARAREAAKAVAPVERPPFKAISPAAGEAGFQTAHAREDATSGPDFTSEARPPPEVESKLNHVWEEFEALKQPTRDGMDGLLTALLALPPEATAWGDILHRFACLNHPDLAGVFRRIAAAVPHTRATGMAFFYWAAAEEFTRRGLAHLLPEVAASFRKLDGESYDADALTHVEDFFLAAGFDTETLQLAEHFLPIERADEGLMPYAVPRRCSLIFELRVGQALRALPPDAPSPERLAKQLRQDLEEEIHEDSARLAAEIAAGRAPTSAWARSQFDLTTGDICEDQQAWQDCLRLFGTLIRVAQEAWQIENQPPASALRGLTQLLNSVYDWKERRAEKSKMSSNNLLDYLRPSGLEPRLVQSCRGLIGVNAPRARLLLQAHELLCRCAARHQLISPTDAAQTAKELARLRRELEGG